MFLTSSLVLLFVTSIIVSILQFYWNRRRLYKLARNIPGHNGFPIVGALPKYLKMSKKNYFDFTFDMMDENSAITKLWIGPKLILLSDNPDVMHTIFNSSHCINKPEMFYDALTVTKGMIPLTGPLYLKHRRILNKAFVPSILQNIQPIIDEKCKKCMEKIEKFVGKEFDIFDYLGACALETFGKAQFKYSGDFYESKELDIIRRSLDLAMYRLTRPWFYFLPNFFYNITENSQELQRLLNFGLEYRKKASKIYNKMKDFDYEAIKNRVIDLLLNPKYEFSDIEIRDEFIIFVLGSFDTTAKTSAVLILMMALHQEVQKKVLAEIDSIYGNSEDLTIDLELINKPEYLEMVIKETLRLFPPAPSIARTNSEEIDICGYRVPKDSAFVLSLMRMQRNPKYWGSDSNLFKPERFENELAYPRAYAPFSGGKRLCIGYRYANMFLRTFLIHFFRTYEVETSLKYEELTLTQGITLNIDQGCMVKLKKRKKILK